jgi:hypothetical protein
MKISTRLVVFVLCALIAFSGCEKISGGAFLTLDQPSLSIGVGDTATLNAAGNFTVQWRTSDAGIAKVSGNGLSAVVTAVSAGKAVITASDGMMEASAVVTVGAVSGAIYIAPYGNDQTGNGSEFYPYFTIGKAEEDVLPGGTVYIRGGLYRYRLEDAENDGGTHSTWFRMFNPNKSGSDMAGHIKYFAYPGDPRPVFDMTAVNPLGKRVQVFYVQGSYLHFKGFDIIGVQVNILDHTQSECIRNDGGSYNIYENIAMHDGKGCGVYLLSGSNNLFLNCDVYNNWDDVSEGGSGENTDGFGAHCTTGSTGNVFSGCRAWANSDDGFDSISCWEGITWDNCWSFYNGYSHEPDGSFVRRGNGQGFKVGGWGMSPGEDESRFPAVTPRHTIQFCVSANNGTNGFDGNFQVGIGSNFYNNTSFGNPQNFNMQARTEYIMADIVSVPGYGHRLINNLSYKPGVAHIANVNLARSTVYNNSWNIEPGFTDDDFMSLDATELTKPRKSDGSLPDVNFMRLKPGGKLADRGVFIRETTSDKIDPFAGALYAGQTVTGVNYTRPMVIPPVSAVTWKADTTPYHPWRGTAPDLGALE